MIQKFIDAWNKNKGNLEEYFRATPQSNYPEYEDLVKLVFDLVINPELVKKGRRTIFGFSDEYCTDRMAVIDDGDYQGTLIFILPENTYQPDVGDYIYTSVYYGSCSGCDTLLGINEYSGGLPTECQIKDYMTLCLHLVEHCDYLWQDKEEK